MLKHPITAFLFACILGMATLLHMHDARAENQGWSKPELMENDDSGDTKFPQIAFDPEGNAISVWSQANGKFLNMWSNRYTAGKGWGKPEIIGIKDSGDASFPRLAIDAKGNAIATWQQGDGTLFMKNTAQMDIWSNRYTPGKGWGKAEIMEAEKGGLSRFSHVAFDSSGNAMVVWERFDGTRFRIWGKRYTPTGGWETAQKIEHNDPGNGNAFWPWIAFDPHGNAISMWHQTDGTRFNIWAVRYTPATGWGTPEKVEHNNKGNAMYPRLAFDSKGNGLAVWQQMDDNMFHARAARYDATKGWEKSRLIENENSGMNGSQPQIAFDSQDNAIAIWDQSSGSRASAWANRYTPGKGWLKPEQISIDNDNPLINPKLAVDSQGNAYSVWHQSDGKVFSIWAARYSPGKGWSKSELLEHDDAMHAMNPEVAVARNGMAMAVWQQADAKQRYSAWASLFR